MKSKEQILEWMKSNKIKGKFLNAKRVWESRQQQCPYHFFEWDENTIDNAFRWSRSLDGDDFWFRYHHRLRDFYNS